MPARAYPADTFAVVGPRVGARGVEARRRRRRQEAKPERLRARHAGREGHDRLEATPDDRQTKQDAHDRVRRATLPGTDVTAARVAGQSRVLFVPASVLGVGPQARGRLPEPGRVRGPPARCRAHRDRCAGAAGSCRSRSEGIWWMAAADLGPRRRRGGGPSGRRSLTRLRVSEFIHARRGPAGARPEPAALPRHAHGREGHGDRRRLRLDALGRQLDLRAPGGQVFTRRDRDIVEELSKEAEAFRDRGCVAFDRGDVDRRSRGRSATTSVRPRAEGRRAGAPAASRCSPASADDVLSAILDLKSRAFVDEAEAQVLAPATATVGRQDRPRTRSPGRSSFHPRAGSARDASRDGPGAFAVRGTPPTELEAAFQKAATPPTPLRRRSPDEAGP